MTTPGNGVESRPSGSQLISTIDEDFYINVGMAYISDEEEDSENCSHDNQIHEGSSSPNTSTVTTTASFPFPTSNHQTIASNSTSISNHDALILSERSSGTTMDGTIDSSSKRDNTNSSAYDTLMLSERSTATCNTNSRRDATGCDSLLLSETTDDTWRNMINLQDDDASSISSTPTTPFPHLKESCSYLIGPSPPQLPLSSPKSPGSGRPPTGSISQRMVGMAGLQAPSVPFPATPDFDDENGDETLEHSHIGNDDADDAGIDDRSLEAQDLEFSQSDQISHRIELNDLPNESERKAHDTYNGSISTSGTLRGIERVGKVPRRWIFDRIDGAVRVSEEEEEGVPQWQRKPPLFVCLPSPLVGMFPWWLEENPLFVAVGKLGFFGGSGRGDVSKTTTDGADPPSQTIRNSSSSNIPVNPIATSISTSTATATAKAKASTKDKKRTLVMGHALLLNACGLFATILSGLALTRSSPGLLEAAPFGKTTVISRPDTPYITRERGDPVTLYLGLLAMGIDNPNASVGGIVLVEFSDFCNTNGMEQFLPPEECDKCASVGLSIAVGFFLATMAYLPNFAISTSRIYKHYDTNCSKIAAGLWSLVSLTGYLLVLSSYHGSCLRSLHDGDVAYTTGGRDLIAGFDWSVGVGQVLFLIGLVLKIVDLVSNCCIATPAMTRSLELQWDYEEGCSLQGDRLENGDVGTRRVSEVDRNQLPLSAHGVGDRRSASVSEKPPLPTIEAKQRGFHHQR